MRFDRWLLGDKDALTAAELKGYQLFKSSGCVACHNGPAVGGNSFQKMGVVEPYQAKSPAEGLSAVTGKDADRFMFKVPTLVNVAKTAPYFHDGMVTTLDDAVVKMAKHQLGKDLSAADAASISLFLNTLTGELPTDYIAMPTLPEGEEKGAKAGGGGGGGGSKAKGKAKAH